MFGCNLYAIRIFVNCKLLHIVLIILHPASINKSLFTASTTLDPLDLNDLVVSILTSCYPDQGTIVLCDSVDSNLAQSLWTLPSTLFILHDYSTISSTARIKQPNKVNLFIVSFESHKRFDKTLLSLKNTLWWNIMATFLIVDRSNGTCENAENILKTVWSFNILTTVFLCRNSNGKLMMFTYNPYTRRAPKPWSRIKTYSETNNRWNAYSRQYHDKDRNTCNNFDFDRTRPLDGYQMNTTFPIFYNNSSLLSPDYDPTKLKTNDMINLDMIITLEKLFNVNLSVEFFKHDLKNHASAYYGLMKGYDFTYGAVPMHTVKNFTLLYPHFSLETVMIMQKKGFYTPLEKIQNYYGVVTVISMLTILTTVFVVVLISQRKKGFSFAVFEILRLFIDASLFSKINTQPLRIFFFVIFTYSLVIHATFYGRLSAFLTKQELRKTPETPEDLKDSYIENIYIPNGISFDYSDPKLNNKVILMDNYDCWPVILNNTAAVCLTNRLESFRLATEHDNLHGSEKPLASNYHSRMARNNWPLKDRADIIMMWFTDLGYTWLWNKKYSEEVEGDIKLAIDRSFVKHRPVSLDDIYFAFVILTFGNVLAAISFLLEILFVKLSKNFIINTII